MLEGGALCAATSNPTTPNRSATRNPEPRYQLYGLALPRSSIRQTGTMDDAEILAEIERLTALLDNKVPRCARCQKPLVGKRSDATTCSAACRVALARQRQTAGPQRPVTVSNATNAPMPGQSRQSIRPRHARQCPDYSIDLIRPSWVRAARQPADDAPDWLDG